MNSRQRTWMKRSLAGLGALTIGMWGILMVISQGPSGSVNAASTAQGPNASRGHANSLMALSEHSTSLPPGPVIVEAMAPWCMYCATAARWVDAADARWAHQHHVPFVLVDVSPLGGVGVAATAPTLGSILKTAHDGTKTPLTTNAEIAANLRRFQQTYHLTMPVNFFSHGQVPISWDVTSLPTYIYFNSHHHVVGRLTGFNTVYQFETWANRMAKDTVKQ